MGGIIICYAQCEPCMYAYDDDSQHLFRAHTWMGDEDLTHAKRTGQVPDDVTEEQLTEQYPCGCWCVRA